MGNQYSSTQDFYQSKRQRSYSNNVFLNTLTNPSIACVAVIDTVHLVGKAAVSSASSHILPDYHKMRVPENISKITNQTAIYIQIFATWLGDGSYSGVGSVFTGAITGTALTHWFAVIKTKDCSQWYLAQLNNNDITFQKCKSHQEAKKLGAKSGGNKDAENFTPKKEKHCSRSLAQIQTWIQNSDHSYHLQFHNCQHWARDLYYWI